MPLVGGFYRDLPFPPPLHSGTAPYSSRFTPAGSQDLKVKSPRRHDGPTSRQFKSLEDCKILRARCAKTVKIRTSKATSGSDIDGTALRSDRNNGSKAAVPTPTMHAVWVGSHGCRRVLVAGFVHSPSAPEFRPLEIPPSESQPLPIHPLWIRTMRPVDIRTQAHLLSGIGYSRKHYQLTSTQLRTSSFCEVQVAASLQAVRLRLTANFLERHDARALRESAMLAGTVTPYSKLVGRQVYRGVVFMKEITSSTSVSSKRTLATEDGTEWAKWRQLISCVPIVGDLPATPLHPYHPPLHCIPHPDSTVPVTPTIPPLRGPGGQSPVCPRFLIVATVYLHAHLEQAPLPTLPSTPRLQTCSDFTMTTTSTPPTTLRTGPCPEHMSFPKRKTVCLPN
ncbi:hypothetical protein PR048_003304 [Dryococelus australis]|uniref:Uncharacterized protein n=1 Tax=Dryococelus australis TaxID=614101 RepID=A0ABQ9IMM2_9NEOP|nr:hypothetical protein PR048_003304 [Dryococelus australis]